MTRLTMRASASTSSARATLWGSTTAGSGATGVMRDPATATTIAGAGSAVSQGQLARALRCADQPIRLSIGAALRLRGRAVAGGRGSGPVHRQAEPPSRRALSVDHESPPRDRNGVTVHWQALPWSAQRVDRV